MDDSSLVDSPPLLPARVACHTEGCGNRDIQLDVLLAGPDGIVICGVCAVQIADVTLLPPTE